MNRMNSTSRYRTQSVHLQKDSLLSSTITTIIVLVVAVTFIGIVNIYLQAKIENCQEEVVRLQKGIKQKKSKIINLKASVAGLTRKNIVKQLECNGSLLSVPTHGQVQMMNSPQNNQLSKRSENIVGI